MMTMNMRLYGLQTKVADLNYFVIPLNNPMRLVFSSSGTSTQPRE